MAVSLIQPAEGVARKGIGANGAPNPPPAKKTARSFFKGASGFVEIIPSFGAGTNGGPFPPLDEHDRLVASGLAPPYFRYVRLAGNENRLYTMLLPSSSDGLVRTARPLTEANATIARVRWLLLSLTLGGALAAALLGRLAANTVLRPVRALARAVREVSATRDL